MKKTRTIVATLCLGFLFSSCLGVNSLTNSIRNWNATVTEQDWANELIFLATIIVPVQQFAWFADVVFFNTWDYWTESPLIEDPGGYPKKN